MICWCTSEIPGFVGSDGCKCQYCTQYLTLQAPWFVANMSWRVILEGTTWQIATDMCKYSWCRQVVHPTKSTLLKWSRSRCWPDKMFFIYHTFFIEVQPPSFHMLSVWSYGLLAVLSEILLTLETIKAWFMPQPFVAVYWEIECWKYISGSFHFCRRR